MKFVVAIVASCLFLLILFATYWLHMTFFKVDVVFYAAIADALISSLMTAVLLFSIRYFAILQLFEKIQLIVIWLLIGYALAISVPTVIDRSLSFYILEKIQQRGGGILQGSMTDVFTNEYLKEHRLVDVRLTEQLQSGTIVIVDDCVMLTEKGQRVATFGRFFRKHLLPKQRLLMGEYTDDLTDPFAADLSVTDYICVEKLK